MKAVNLFLTFLSLKATTILTGNPPSFISTWVNVQANSGSDSERQKTIPHTLGSIPAKVDVQIKVTKNGKDYIFTGIGSAQRDDDECEDYGGVVYYYDDTNVYLALPYETSGCGTISRGVAYTGSATRYDGPSELQGIFFNGQARVRAWSSAALPTPLFDFYLDVSDTSANCFKSLNHGGSTLPDLVIAQAQFTCDGTTCVSEAQGHISGEKTVNDHNVFGGLLLGYDETVVKLWTPRQYGSCSSCGYNGAVFAAMDGWGTSDRYVNSATVRIRGYQLEKAFRTEFKAGKDITSPGTVSFGQSFSMDTDLVTVQVRELENGQPNAGMIFSGVGSSVTYPAGIKFSGVVYAYNNDSVYLYTKSSSSSDGYMIYIADRWGDGTVTSAAETADVIVTVFADACPTPDNVANATFVSSSTASGGQVVYTCDTGFTHYTGDMVRTCVGRAWNGTLPSCQEIECLDPAVENATYTTTNGFKINSVVEYRCHTGHGYKSGHLNRICEDSGLWWGTPPTCLLIDCLDPGPIANGSNTYTALSVGSTVTYVCDSGYGYEAGDLTRTCQFGGNWDGVPPVCSAIETDCLDPGPVSNASYVIDPVSMLTVGSTVTYSCLVGYNHVTGNLIRRCKEDRTWDGVPPVCSGCSVPDMVANAMHIYDGLKIGSIVSYTCDTGYYLVTGQLTRQCISGGTWDGMPPVCSGCSVPDDVANATYSYDGLTIGSTVTYTCDSGSYLVTGQLSRECIIGGKWDGLPPVCSAKRCSDPGPVINATYTVTGLSPTDTATYTCDPVNTHIAGDSVRTCQADETWSGTPIICITQVTSTPTCSDPGPVSNALYAPSSLTIGSTVTYSCLTGFSHIIGNLIRTCKADKTWDGVPPVCLGCSVPETTSNATFTYDGLTIGSTATYTCDFGYYLVTGELTRQCISGGTWDGVPPVCSAKRCSDPGPVINATYVLTGLSTTDTATYACDSGSTHIAGDRVRSCQADETWSGTPIICITHVKQCSDPGPVMNATYTFTGLNPSDTATYICDSGNVQKGGDSVRTCQTDETWSGIPIVCIAHATCSVVRQTVTYTPETLAESIEKTKQELTVDKKETNSFVRSLTSAKDPRPSSTYIGTAGVALLCSLVVALILPDIFTLYQHIKIFSSIYKRIN